MESPALQSIKHYGEADGLGLLSLEVLDLSANRLEGELPGALGEFQYLRVLRLSKNKFSGSIGRLATDGNVRV